MKHTGPAIRVQNNREYTRYKATIKALKID